MNAIHTLGWTLIHSLWQSTLAAAGPPALLTGVPARRAPRGHRLGAARDSHPAQRADGRRAYAMAARRPAGPRAGPHPAARLRREPAAGGNSGTALLPSRRVVGLGAGAPGARALL